MDRLKPVLRLIIPFGCLFLISITHISPAAAYKVKQEKEAIPAHSLPAATGRFPLVHRQMERLGQITQKRLVTARSRLKQAIAGGKAYDSDGIESYAEYKGASSLVHSYQSLRDKIPWAEENREEETRNSSSIGRGGKPAKAAFISRRDEALILIRHFRAVLEAVQSGDEAVKDRIEQEAFPAIAAGTAADLYGFWMDRRSALKRKGIESTGEGRQANAELQRWGELLERSRQFKEGEPAAMRRELWRAWDWIPAAFKTEEQRLIERNASEALGKWNDAKGAFEDRLDKASAQGSRVRRNSSPGSIAEIRREMAFWKRTFDEWKRKLEYPMETEARHSLEASEEARLEWKLFAAEYGTDSPRSQAAESQYLKLRKAAEALSADLVRYRKSREVYEGAAISYRDYKTGAYFPL